MSGRGRKRRKDGNFRNSKEEENWNWKRTRALNNSRGGISGEEGTASTSAFPVCRLYTLRDYRSREQPAGHIMHVYI